MVKLFNNGCIESFETYKKEGWEVPPKLRDRINAIQKEAYKKSTVAYKEDRDRRAVGAEKDIKRLAEKAIRDGEKAAKATERATQEEIRAAEKVAKEAEKKAFLESLATCCINTSASGDDEEWTSVAKRKK